MCAHRAQAKAGGKAAVSRVVKEHNERIKSLVHEGLLPVARSALLYGTSDTRPRLVLVPVGEEWDPACGAPPEAEDFDVSYWFENTPQIAAVHEFPGTSWFLANSFDILITAPPRADKGAEKAPINETLQRLFSVDWRGNLIIMKRSSRDGRVIHITRPETSLINVVLQRWLATTMP